MSKQLHKNFIDEQVKLLLKSYMDKEIKINYILSILGIKRRRFFKLLARYKKDPDNFSIQYNRKTINRKMDQESQKNIIKNIFCLRADRMVNPYRKVSINKLELKVPKAPLHESIRLRIVPDRESGLSEVRFWYEDEFLGIQKVKNSELNLVQL